MGSFKPPSNEDFVLSLMLQMLRDKATPRVLAVLTSIVL